MSILEDGWITRGGYATEADSAAALDMVLDECGLWRVFSEVRGRLLQPRPAQLDKSLRIDRVLVPTERLLKLGWRHGIIGVEIKCSGHKTGPPIAQALDYSRAVWTLPGGFSVWLDYVFVFPMGAIAGPLASVLIQNRIGWAYGGKRYLTLTCGQNLIDIRHGAVVRLDDRELASGRKVGSR